ncbi:MAG: OmpH family outer membrane protein [Bacteroidota bacterium]|nr:OmpH family outer membrane protein [Candidatus Kapabacteria bacterium]MCS7302426.1 OmpH family outer membrane protein [Candidatus Kapabacteria bacterium]MCX7937100.1 OmpH family outer membrane protein [Chlorobiota bacterium]MDW8074593.1 OmpH family outer membrane protein [Bacteroidota bacterium]MDW8270931.1 OmpH family outer membrane protein [Bacteroidota bacterium]
MLVRVLSVAIFLVSLAFAQKDAGSKESTLRIAVADLEKIAKELPEAVAADRELTELRKRYLDTLQMMETRFKERFEQYQKSKAMMTADAQRKEEDELRALQQQYALYQEEKFGLQGELARRRDSLLSPILKKVQEAVAAVAKEERYNFVFDRGSSFLLYAEDKADITYKVLDRIKRGK